MKISLYHRYLGFLKTTFLFLFVLGNILISYSLHSEEINVKSLSNPKNSDTPWGNILDTSEFLDSDSKTKIQNELNNLEKEKGAQIGIVILPSIGNQDPKEFAVELFQHWGIGRKGIDDGLLILLVLDQRKWIMETGYGLEGILPDVTLKRLGERELVPMLRENKPGEGFLKLVRAIITKIKSDIDTSREELNSVSDNPNSMDQEEDSGWSILSIIAVGLYIGLALFVILIWTGHFVEIQEKEMSVDDRLKEFHKEWKSPWMIASILMLLPAIPIIIIIFLGFRNSVKKSKKICPECGENSFELLTKQRSLPFMAKWESIENKLNRLKTTVWLCSRCDHRELNSVRLSSNDWDHCPSCKHYTKESKFIKSLKKPTYSKKGLNLYEDSCENCGYFKEKKISVPKLVKESYSSSSGSNWSTLSSSTSYSSSSSMSSSSSSSGSSWGGGSSGGGGASGSW